MVATTRVTVPSKNADKIPASQVNTVSKRSISPTGSPTSSNDELLALRARNKVLTEALAAIHESAEKELKEKYDLVWYAKYRYRHHNHEACDRIDNEYQEEIEKLRSNDGDFHHGFNSGVLAAVRMFKKKADILHINEHEQLSPDLMLEAKKHAKKIEEARRQFPQTDVSNDFPHLK